MTAEGEAAALVHMINQRLSVLQEHASDWTSECGNITCAEVERKIKKKRSRFSLCIKSACQNASLESFGLQVHPGGSSAGGPHWRSKSVYRLQVMPGLDKRSPIPARCLDQPVTQPEKLD
ncbi:hypothetical protein JOB18_034406 [Solea senegalensis]|uniref:Uncharacterized protein n=1 Tax=Solea senegalensis TaxID=28829 RepID=A0AAV6Q5P2_SOLSE|nr:hypothetical protein JOB18_034406 [Solea senegalensis]